MTIHTALLALFGDDGDGEDLDEIAALLETEATAAAVERELRALRDTINETYGSVEHRLDGRQAVAVDAGPRSKAEAIERAVRSGSVESNDESATVARAAGAVRDEMRPDSVLARQLLDLAAGEHSSTRQLEDVFEEAAERLDEQARAQSALDASVDVDSVPELVDDYRETKRGARSRSSDRDRLTDAVESLLDELDVDAEGSLEGRVRAATQNVRAGAENGGSELEEDVTRARNRTNPRSRRARRLFDALEEGDDVKSALTAAATRLDEAATADAVMEDVDSDEVAELADSVADDLDDARGSAAAALCERAVELGNRVERAGDSNRVVAFAAREELSFYRQLLREDALEAQVSSGSESLDRRLEAVSERRRAVERDYVDERSDHNHSIPLYFLSLVDAVVEDAAEQAADGRSERAAGTVDVAERLLDHVEGLYEQNQYSVMLRSLRG